MLKLPLHLGPFHHDKSLWFLFLIFKIFVWFFTSSFGIKSMQISLKELEKNWDWENCIHFSLSAYNEDFAGKAI